MTSFARKAVCGKSARTVWRGGDHTRRGVVRSTLLLTVEVDKDGTFRVSRPKKVNFFKVRLETKAETFK